ncbi:hypothetical protein [Salinigranum sp. GCM10025319]
MRNTTAFVLTAGHLVGATAAVGSLAVLYFRDRVADAARSLKPSSRASM